jgi:hypothetical protein
MQMRTFFARHACAILLVPCALMLSGCGRDNPIGPDPRPMAGASAVAVALNVSGDVTLAVGQSLTLRSNGSRTPRSSAWISSNSTVASVTSAGVVTARAVGEALITVSGFGTNKTTRIIVTQAVSAVNMTLTPKTGATLVPGQSRQFNTSVAWSDGIMRTTSITYSSPGGTISNAGLFTAGQVAGTFAVIASCVCGLADTALVTVSAAQLTALAISPKSVSVAAGGVQQFSVSAAWATGATTPPPVTYTAPDGGAVTATGRFTAPAANGTYRVVVTHTGGTLSDVAMVTVTGGTAPTNSGSFTQHLPPGMTLYSDTRFGNLLPQQQFNSDGLALAYDARNAVDEGAPFGRNVFEVFYPANDAGNGRGGGWLFGRGGQQWTRVYFSLMMWVPSNYSIHTNMEKFFYPIIVTPGFSNQGTAMNWMAFGGANGSHFGFALNAQISGQGWIYPSASGARVRKGAWTRVEMYCEMNTPGRPDGVWRVWVDGVPAVDVSNIRYSAHPVQSFFDGIRFTGTRGGGASAVLTPTGGQVRRYNRLAFYGSRN